MRLWILALTFVSVLTAITSSRFSLGDEMPTTLPVTQSESVVPTVPSGNKHMWELDGAVFKTLASQSSSQLGTARLGIRRFLNDSLSVGADFRYWPSGSYPLSGDADSGVWAAGGAGQLYLFRSTYIGAYLGGSLLWVPNYSEATFAPEAGFKWFVSQRVALGVSYWILTDLGSYTTSFEPPFTGKSRQSLGFELSVFL